ncbi:ATP synthase F1 subunit epsilon [Candidatus Saccharibacteria bacterium]|nr:ATP synthase F1 subunit epsilon [Candidatus Saccharibacteria bacterium]
MTCELITLDGTKYDGDFTEVLVTTANGMMVVLPHHEPFAGVIKPGPVTIHNGQDKDTFAVFGGLIEVTPSSVRLLTDMAEHSDELDLAAVERALAEAEKLKKSASSRHELHQAQTLIDRHQVRLDVLKIHRNRNRHHSRPGREI